MPKGKGQKATFYCSECKKGNYTLEYRKRADAPGAKELNKHCQQCRKHTLHKRKDLKKPVQN